MANQAIPSPLAERVIALALAGMRPIVIVDKLDGAVKLGKIYHLVSEARAQGRAIPRFGTGPHPGRKSVRQLQIRIAGDIEAKLNEAARGRKTSLSELVARIVDAVAYDDLVDAVLDDREAIS